MAPGRDAERSRAHVLGATDIERRIADHNGVGGGECRAAACRYGGQRLGHEHVAMRRRVAESTAWKVFPEIEIFELEPRAGFVVARDEREVHVVSRGERIEKLTDAGHQTFARRSGLLEFGSEVAEVSLSKTCELW